MAGDEVFFTLDRLFSAEALRHEESVGGDAQGGMVVEPAPAAALVVAEAKVLLEVLVVALDTPALMSHADEFVEGRVLGQRGQN